MGLQWVRGVVSAAGIMASILLAAPSAQGAPEKILYNFCTKSNCTDGANPNAVLLQDVEGNLYGATYFGGVSGTCVEGCGVLFKLSPTGQETVLHAFTDGADGTYPQAGLIEDAQGNLYGTVFSSGTGCGDHGCGAVFKVSAAGKFSVLYSFTDGADGGYPLGGLVEDAKGNLYGTTSAGGVGNGCNNNGCGTVFELNPAGVLTVLHTFTGGIDGGNPQAGLLLDAEGNLYGTTFEGGGKDCGGTGCGVIFKQSASGKYSVLHRFTRGADGANPVAGLIRDAERNIYGTTEFGGSKACGPEGCGVVFKLSPAGKVTALYSFQGGTDGANPVGGVVQDATGNLYGTTFFGGGQQCGLKGICGVIFKVTPTGEETVLSTFDGANGSDPSAGLILGAGGELYGTAFFGGKHNSGVVFEISP